MPQGIRLDSFSSWSFCGLKVRFYIIDLPKPNTFSWPPALL